MTKLITLFILSLLATPALSEDRCGNTIAMIEKLHSAYEEYAVVEGLYNDSGTLFSMFVNIETGTWSLLESYTDGTSCFVLVGQDAVVDLDNILGETF